MLFWRGDYDAGATLKRSCTVFFVDLYFGGFPFSFLVVIPSCVEDWTDDEDDFSEGMGGMRCRMLFRFSHGRLHCYRRTRFTHRAMVRLGQLIPLGLIFFFIYFYFHVRASFL